MADGEAAALGLLFVSFHDMMAAVGRMKQRMGMRMQPGKEEERM